MKNILNNVVIITLPILLLLTFEGSSQKYSLEQQNQIDSLSDIINNLNSHDTSLARAYVDLSEILYISNLDTAVSICFKVLSVVKRTYSSEPSGTIKRSLLLSQSLAINNIAYAYHFKGNHDLALKYFKHALKIQKELNDKKALSTTYYNIGTVYIQNNIPKSLYYFKLSLELQKSINYKQGIAYNMGQIGLIYKNLGDIDKVLKYYFKGLKLHEEIKDYRGVADSQNNIGAIYHKQSDYINAKKFYLMGLKTSKKIGHKYGISTALSSLGVMNLDQENFPLAMKYLHKALKLSEEIDNKQNIALCKFNVCGGYFRQQDYVKSLKYLFESLNLYEELDDKQGILKCLDGIGSIYLIQGKVLDAENLASRSYNLAKERGLVVETRNAARLLTKIYKKQGRGLMALEMYEIYAQMKDSIKNDRTKETAIRQQANYEIEKKENEIKLLNKEKQLKSTQFRLSIIIYGVVLTFLASLAIFWFRYRKKRYESELNELRALKLSLNELKKEITSIPVNLGKKIFSINLIQIAFFDTRDKYVFLNTLDGKSYIVDYTINQLEELLPNNFVRIHRSFVINKNEIREMVKTYKGKVALSMNGTSNKKIPSSLSYSQQVKQLIQEFKFKEN